jgi:hypothetical protein
MGLFSLRHRVQAYHGVKWPGREADQIPPSSAEVKNAWSYTYTSLIRLYGVVIS